MKLKELKLFTMNLQKFTEGDSDGENSDVGGDSGAKGDGGEDSSADDEGGKKGEQERSYNDAEVDRIVAKHKAEWERAHKADLEKAKDEARKYERMSKEERAKADQLKAEEEAKAKDARIAELEAKIAEAEMRKTVASELEALPEGFVASQDFLDATVSGDAEKTKAQVERLKRIILDDRKRQEEKRARGNTPRSYGSGGKEMSRLDAMIAEYSK